jgi:acyl-CoA synthetase (NDP forming)
VTIDFEKARTILSGTPGTLLEADVYELLEGCGLTAPKRCLLAPEQIDRLESLPTLPGDHVYLKLQADGLLHKTEAGAVRRVANNADAVRDAAQEMIAHCGVNPDSIRGVLVVESINADASAVPLEMILGARRLRDFGPIVALGIGGVAAEFWNPRLRTEHAVQMVSAVDLEDDVARAFVQRMPLRPLWSGYRGGSRLLEDADLARWVQVLAVLIEYFDGSSPERSPQIVEAEMNPLVVRDGEIYPLDGLIRTSDEAAVMRPAAPADRLQALLHPKTVAVAGVSGKGLNPGRIIIRNLLAGGFQADHLAILKPGGGEVDGVACFEAVDDVSFNIDLLVLAVDAKTSVQILEHAGQKVKSALLIAAGTSETENGEELGRRLADAIDQSGVAAIGPNCLGIISRPAGLDTLFIPKYKIPRGDLEPSDVAYISQSGAFMITRMNRITRFEPRYGLSTGNQLRTGVSDALAAVAADESVRTFAIYVEGFGDGDGLRFCQLARELTAEGRRAILYKGGRTAAGATAASGHTASLATDYGVCRQLAEQAGVLVVESFNAFEDLVQLSTCWGRAEHGCCRMGVASNAGYECVGIADSLGAPLSLAELDDATTDAIKRAFAICRIDTLIDVHNPVDLTPMATSAVWCGVASALLKADNVDIALINPVPPTPALQTLVPGDAHREDVYGPEQIAAQLGAVIRASAKPVACCVDCGPIYDAFAAELAKHAGPAVPVFRSADRAIRAIRTWATVGR